MQHRSLPAVAALTVLLWSLLPAVSAAAATSPETDVIVRLVSDGTAPFDITDEHGLDTGPDNRRVRTFDTVRYHVDYQFNHASDVAKRVVLHTDAGTIVAPPASCAHPTVSASGDTLTCEIGSLPAAGAVGSFDVDVTVGARRDGETLTVSATSSAGGTAATSTADPLTITASPRWNIAAAYDATVLFSPERDAYVAALPVTVEADLTTGSGRGVEGLAGDLSFTMTPDFSASPTPIAYRLLDGTLRVQSMDLGPCGGLALGNWNMPYGTTTPGASRLNTADVGGTWSCDQPGGPGTPIQVTLTGADLAPLVLPQVTTANVVPLFPRKVLVSGEVLVTIDHAEVSAALTAINGTPEGVVPFGWSVGAFDPTGLSGGSNFGDGVEDPFDNAGNAAITQFTPGVGDALFMGDYTEMNVDHPAFGPGTYVDQRPAFMDPLHNSLPPSQTEPHSGDGVVAPGQTFTYALSDSFPADQQGVSVHNSMQCAFIDTTTMTIIDQPDVLVSDVDARPGPTYGTTTSRAFRPGAATPVHVQTLSSMTVLWSNVGSPSNDLGYVVEYGTGPAPASRTCGDQDSATGWTTDPSTTPGAGNGRYPGITMVRIRTLRPIGPGDGIEAWISLRANDTIRHGDTLVARAAYATWPVGTDWSSDAATWMSAPYDPADHQGESLRWGDRLGAAERIVLTTKSIVGGDPGPLTPGDEVTFTVTATPMGSAAAAVTMTDTLPAGLALVSSDVAPDPSSTADTLVWSWGRTEPSTTRRVTYRVRVTDAAPNGSTLVNQVHTDVPDLSDAGSVTDAAASVRTATDYAQLDVWKTTATPTVQVGDHYSFTVSSKNTSNVDLTGTRWIDVLPWNGDDRAPSTAFHGTTRLDAVSVSAGSTLEFAPTANAADDVYTNNVAGRDDQTPLLARSEDVTVTVISPTNLTGPTSSTTTVPTTTVPTTTVPTTAVPTTSPVAVSPDSLAGGAGAGTGGDPSSGGDAAPARQPGHVRPLGDQRGEQRAEQRADRLAMTGTSATASVAPSLVMGCAGAVLVRLARRRRLRQSPSRTPGLRIRRGSSAALTARIASISAAERDRWR